MIANNEVTFKVRFQKDQRIPSFVENLEEFISTFRKKFSPKCSSDELVNQDSIYEGTLYEISVTLTYKGIDTLEISDFIFETLANQWCNMCRERNIPGWLAPVFPDNYSNKIPFHTDITTKEFAFGTLPDMCHFVQHYHHQSQVVGELLCSFYHQQKRLSLFISWIHNNCGKKESLQKIDVQYDMISRIIINDLSGNDCIEIFFQLNCPPHVYSEMTDRKIKDNSHENPDESDDNSERNYSERQWERSLTVGCDCNDFCRTKDIGRALVFKVVLGKTDETRCIVERLFYRCDRTAQFYYTYIETVSLHTDLNNIESMFLHDIIENNLITETEMFSCLYAWQLLFCRSLVIRDKINLRCYKNDSDPINQWGILIETFLVYVYEDPEALCLAFFHVSDILCRNDIFEFEDAVRILFEHYCENEQDNDLLEGMHLVRRLIITPSRMILLPPTEIYDNRITREIVEAREYILRVSIQDDDFSKLTYAVQYHSQKSEFMSEVVGNVLKEGIRIGNRSYEFLASSTSQMREHSLWCYANDSQGRTATTIKEWMGDFSKIEKTSKCMARMGQCFSTSDEAIQISLENCNVRYIEDIEVEIEGRKYVFSDGIGKISPDLAKKVRGAKKLNPYKQTTTAAYEPSAFQIRYKGCKGVLAEDTTLKGLSMEIRPSMQKFECKTANKLEIIRMSGPRVLYLNRPLITILEQMGVPDEEFLELQKNTILDLMDSLLYEDKAASTLERYLPLNIPFQVIRKSGIHLTDEPFFRSLLIANYHSSIDQLKSKTRIPVPPNCGRNMLGVLDETRTLKYGEVFVQYSEDIGYRNSKTHVHEGIVVVSKNPCMHPGDVRKLRAVNVDALHHHKDCIVFPAPRTNDRPHPDEIAGSDLDGDEYIVIWMLSLKFPSVSHEPMIYPMKKDEKGKNSLAIGVNEMVDFLCKFIQCDDVGTLASAHMAWADRSNIFTQPCMQIAEKFGFALDFPKTGHTKQLSKSERPFSYPDFMKKGSEKCTYRSEKVLGYLYRFAKTLEACVDKESVAGDIEPDPMLCYTGWERYQESAKKHKNDYVTRITAILNKYKASSEAEALTGYIGGISRGNHEKRESRDTSRIMIRYLKSTMKNYRFIFYKELEEEVYHDNLTVAEETLRSYQKASAWYIVSYESGSSNVISFPWILSDILVKIYKGIPCDSMKSKFFALSNNYLMNIPIVNEQQGLPRPCRCVKVTLYMLKSWVEACNRTFKLFSAEEPCFDCTTRALAIFRSKFERCCRWNRAGCSCSEQNCSPIDFIMAFMKFYILHTVDIGICKNASICLGFQYRNLQIAALQTYANLAVNKSDQYLWLSKSKCETALYKNIMEGDPIRISVSPNLRNFIEKDLEKLKTVLMSMTGVQDVQIVSETELENEHFILISSTGTDFQRSYLEEVILEEKKILEKC